MEMATQIQNFEPSMCMELNNILFLLFFFPAISFFLIKKNIHLNFFIPQPENKVL
jgi:hypothetical protein